MWDVKNSQDYLFQGDHRGIWGKLNSILYSSYLLHLATIAVQKQQKIARRKLLMSQKFRFPQKYNKIKVRMSKNYLYCIFVLIARRICMYSYPRNIRTHSKSWREFWIIKLSKDKSIPLIGIIKIFRPFFGYRHFYSTTKPPILHKFD